jgi:uncharacterized alpha/beta hydrolase family protein
MKTYIAQWENGTISVLTAKNKTDLFWKLDSEGDPISAKIFVVPTDEEGNIHITTNIIKKKNEPVIYFGSYCEEIKRARWEKGTTLKAMKQICPNATEQSVKNIIPLINITYK